MADTIYDVAVLGGGTGGYVAAIRGAQLGLNVVLVEQDKVGGTCLHRGCIPTKALLESAEVLHLARSGSDFGIQVGETTFDYAKILARKQQVVDQLHKGVEGLLKNNKVTVHAGQGTLLSPTKVQVVLAKGGTLELGAGHVIIATGSVPKSLPGLDFDGKTILSSDHVLELAAPPASMVIVGAGAVGVEFASLLNDLSVEVTLVEALPRLVPGEDQEVSSELARRFKARGIQFMTGARLLSETFRRTKAGMSIDVEVEGKPRTLTAERLLIAVGRGARLDGIDPEKLGIQLERGYIKVDSQMRTGNPEVYAIGDAIGGMLLAHVAAAEGHVAVETIAGRYERPLDYNRVPRCTYCRPQIASMGLSEQQAADQGYAVKTGKFPFAANGRALIAGESGGFCKIVSDASSGEILGVHIIGHQATELIAEAALGRFLEATPLDIGLSIHAHPTLAEAVGEAALDVERQAIHIFRR